jgi:hypothetical protein
MRACLLLGMLCVMGSLVPATAAKPALPPAVPFIGSADEQPISAVPVDADHVFVTTVGAGKATHLGNFTFVSPHLSGLSDFSIDGTQTITTASGDLLETRLIGNLSPVVDETGHVFLVGDINGTITGGTGRFENASGEFTFSIVFDTETFHSTSTIAGEIRYAGK